MPSGRAISSGTSSTECSCSPLASTSLTFTTAPFCARRANGTRRADNDGGRRRGGRENRNRVWRVSQADGRALINRSGADEGPRGRAHADDGHVPRCRAPPDFRSLLLGHLGGTLAQLMITVAVGIDVLARTESSVWVSVTVALGFAPYVVFSGYAGLLADRHSRSLVLAWSFGPARPARPCSRRGCPWAGRCRCWCSPPPWRPCWPRRPIPRSPRPPPSASPTTSCPPPTPGHRRRERRLDRRARALGPRHAGRLRPVRGRGAGRGDVPRRRLVGLAGAPTPARTRGGRRHGRRADRGHPGRHAQPAGCATRCPWPSWTTSCTASSWWPRSCSASGSSAAPTPWAG